MNNYSKKLSAAVAMAAVIGSALAPVAMADSINISGNGMNSNNTVVVTNSNVTTVNQTNHSLIVNGISAVSNSGGNTANGNTGDDVNVTSGNATTNVTVNNTGPSNDADLPECGCPTHNTTVNIEKNGKNTTNTVVETNTNALLVNQKNRSAIINMIGAKAKSGKNKANGNTGSGDTTVKAGNATTNVVVNNLGPSNILH